MSVQLEIPGMGVQKFDSMDEATKFMQAYSDHNASKKGSGLMSEIGGAAINSLFPGAAGAAGINNLLQGNKGPTDLETATKNAETVTSTGINALSAGTAPEVDAINKFLAQYLQPGQAQSYGDVRNQSYQDFQKVADQSQGGNIVGTTLGSVLQAMGTGGEGLLRNVLSGGLSGYSAVAGGNPSSDMAQRGIGAGLGAGTNLALAGLSKLGSNTIQNIFGPEGSKVLEQEGPFVSKAGLEQKVETNLSTLRSAMKALTNSKEGAQVPEQVTPAVLRGMAKNLEDSLLPKEATNLNRMADVLETFGVLPIKDAQYLKVNLASKGFTKAALPKAGNVAQGARTTSSQLRSGVAQALGKQAPVYEGLNQGFVENIAAQKALKAIKGLPIFKSIIGIHGLYNLEHGNKSIGLLETLLGGGGLINKSPALAQLLSHSSDLSAILPAILGTSLEQTQ